MDGILVVTEHFHSSIIEARADFITDQYIRKLLYVYRPGEEKQLQGWAAASLDFSPIKKYENTETIMHAPAVTAFIAPYPIFSRSIPAISGPTARPKQKNIEFIAYSLLTR